jgi:thiol-disulfide isomerase/thioredoxin
MNTNKKIGLIVIVLVVIGSIWYLESGKVHSGGTGQAVQTLNVDSTSTVADTATSSMEATTTTAPALSANLKATLATIAAADKAAGDQPAIEIEDPTGFINVSSTFKLASLIGNKVVLLDFWTYSCINCVRTIPYLNAWYQKYQSQGLVIVGIHTPEFDFEKNITNVQAAVKQYGIQYPVVLDSNQGTWNAYNNLYWPHEYLIDMAGYIVHDHVGEGDYAATEAEIQKLLQQRATVLGTNPATIPTGTVSVTSSNLNEINSPETYFGAARNSLLANGTSLTNGNQTLMLPANINGNALYLGGTWDFEDQYATNISSGAQIKYEYDAKNVYIVAAGTSAGVTMDVMQDGKPITDANAGSDVHNGKVIITGNKLYNLVSNSDGGGEHILQLTVEQPGLQAFTFTFG